MNQLLDFTGAILALLFRVVTAPLLLLLFTLVGVINMISVLRSIQITLPPFSFRWSAFHLPVHWKRKLLFSRS